MSTPREEANALLQTHGLASALRTARKHVKIDRYLQRPTVRSQAVVDHLKTLAKAVADLRTIIKADPIGDLAARLVAAGVTAGELQAALDSNKDIERPFTNKLQNKHRDAALDAKAEYLLRS